MLLMSYLLNFPLGMQTVCHEFSTFPTFIVWFYHSTCSLGLWAQPYRMTCNSPKLLRNKTEVTTFPWKKTLLPNGTHLMETGYSEYLPKLQWKKELYLEAP